LNYNHNRPRVCLDHNCHCIMNCYTDEHFDLGYSFNCIGKMDEENSTRWNQVLHKNGYVHCIYTPFKGLIRYMINANDAEISYQMMAKILEDAYHTECCECHETGREGMNYLRIKDKYYCTRCAVRLGYLTWDGKYYIVADKP